MKTTFLIAIAIMASIVANTIGNAKTFKPLSADVHKLTHPHTTEKPKNDKKK